MPDVWELGHHILRRIYIENGQVKRHFHQNAGEAGLPEPIQQGQVGGALRLGPRIKDGGGIQMCIRDRFVPASNCLETSLSNIGALFHPTPVLLNIGRIENDLQGFRYYWDGITPSVATLVGEIDQERMAVARAYGVSVPLSLIHI